MRRGAIDNGADGVAEVVQQVPAVSNLNGVWGALAHPVGVGAGTVACDHLDAGMLAKPGGQCFRLPIGQEVHDAVTLQVDQDGSVTVATAPGPIINGKDTGRRRGRLAGGRGRHAQQRVGADRYGEANRQSRSGFAAEGERHVALQTAEPLGPAGGSCGDVLKALYECFSGAGGIAAPKPPGSHSDRHGSALPRQVAQLAEIAAMEPPGC